MGRQEVALTTAAVAGLICAAAAVACIWVLLADPAILTVASSSTVARSLAGLVVDVVRGATAALLWMLS